MNEASRERSCSRTCVLIRSVCVCALVGWPNVSRRFLSNLSMRDDRSIVRQCSTISLSLARSQFTDLLVMLVMAEYRVPI